MERYIELVEYNIYSRGNMINVIDYVNGRRNYEAYTSLFMFKSDVIDYVKNNISEKTNRPSIEGYIGECQASYLWIDIDIEGNLPAATAKMIDVVMKIHDKYKITHRSLSIFFSGNKGYHVGIPTKSFGADDYSSDILPKVFKSMVEAMVGFGGGVDKKIYNSSRIFRAPYSQHPKSMKYKIPVDYEKLVAGDMNEMLIDADFCRRHCTYQLVTEFSDELKKLFNDCVQNSISSVDLYEDNDGYQTAISLSSNSSIFRLPKQGERNDLIYRMAYRLFSTKELKVNEISDMLKFIYEITNDYSARQGWSRYSEMEFRISINSAYSRTRLKPVTNMKASDFTSLVVSMYDKIRKSQFIETFDSEITLDLKGGWKLGDLYCLIGKGGTMKSYLLQEECIRTSLERKQNSLYCNLEMSDITFFDRVWATMFQESMTDMVRDGKITEQNIESYAFSVKELMANYLHIFSDVDVEPSDIEGIIKRKEDEIKGKIILSGIDSVGGMKELGDNEGVNAKRISKYLKEAAKNTNSAILLINHARNDCPDVMRDCSPFVRGGSKFIDNCDAYLSLSKVVDKEASNFEKDPKDIVFKKSFKYLRFVNKRGSGNTISKIIEFGDYGRVVVKEDNPIDYEINSFESGGYTFKM